MTNLLGTIKETEAASQSATDAALAEQWRQYRELLERADPRKGDEARLAELVKALGLTAAHVELHKVVVTEADTYKRQITAGAEAARAAQQARLAIAELERKVAAHRQTIDGHAKAVGFANGATALAGDAEDRLCALQYEYPGLLGDGQPLGPLPVPAQRFGAAGPSQSVADKKRELGL